MTDHESVNDQLGMDGNAEEVDQANAVNEEVDFDIDELLNGADEETSGEDTAVESQPTEETPVETKTHFKSHEEAEKGYANLRTAYDRAQTEAYHLKKRVEELEKHISQPAQTNTADEELTVYEQDPDFVNAFNKMMRKMGIDPNDMKVLKEMKADRETTQKEKAIGYVKSKHPDFDELVQNQSFTKWVSELSPIEQQTINQDPVALTRYIDMYKASNKVTSEKAPATPQRKALPTDAKKMPTYDQALKKISLSDPQYRQKVAKLDRLVLEGKIKTE